MGGGGVGGGGLGSACTHLGKAVLGSLSSWWGGVQGTHCLVISASHCFVFPPGPSQVGTAVTDSHESGRTHLLPPRRQTILGSLGASSARQGKTWTEEEGTGARRRWKVPKTKVLEEPLIPESKHVGFTPSSAPWASPSLGCSPSL